MHAEIKLIIAHEDKEDNNPTITVYYYSFGLLGSLSNHIAPQNVLFETLLLP